MPSVQCLIFDEFGGIREREGFSGLCRKHRPQKGTSAGANAGWVRMPWRTRAGRAVGNGDIPSVLDEVLQIYAERQSAAQGDLQAGVEVSAPFPDRVAAVIIHADVIFCDNRYERTDRLFRSGKEVDIFVIIRPFETVVDPSVKAEKTEERVVLAGDGKEARDLIRYRSSSFMYPSLPCESNQVR